MTQVLIEARSLSRRYGTTLAVSDLDLTLHKGEILGLLGPNGAGKSTAMKMLTGCLAPTSGSVEIDGQSLSENPKAAKARLGYLPEAPPVYSELTVDEYLNFCARLHRVPARARADAVAHAKQSSGLAGMAQRLIGNLSKGYQQRVGIAQAIVHTPEVVVLDEPTVGLDPIQIREIRKLIRELGDRHSVILSSHILPEVQSVCDRVMIINHGKVVYQGSVEDATRQRSEAAICGFGNAPEAGVFKAIAGVRDATHMEDGRWRIDYDTGADPRRALVQAAADGGWLLDELRPLVKTLEERFVELTSGEQAAGEDAPRKEAA